MYHRVPYASDKNFRQAVMEREEGAMKGVFTEVMGREPKNIDAMVNQLFKKRSTAVHSTGAARLRSLGRPSARFAPKIQYQMSSLMTKLGSLWRDVAIKC